MSISNELVNDVISVRSVVTQKAEAAASATPYCTSATAAASRQVA